MTGRGHSGSVGALKRGRYTPLVPGIPLPWAAPEHLVCTIDVRRELTQSLVQNGGDCPAGDYSILSLSLTLCGLPNLAGFGPPFLVLLALPLLPILVRTRRFA